MQEVGRIVGMWREENSHPVSDEEPNSNNKHQESSLSSPQGHPHPHPSFPHHEASPPSLITTLPSSSNILKQPHPIHETQALSKVLHPRLPLQHPLNFSLPITSPIRLLLIKPRLLLLHPLQGIQLVIVVHQPGVVKILISAADESLAEESDPLLLSLFARLGGGVGAG